jgi:uncharacterized protein (DUF952 family)
MPGAFRRRSSGRDGLGLAQAGKPSGARCYARRMIFHIALPEDWAAAQAAGAYTVSTRGVSLDEQGFIHAGENLEQVEFVRSLAYSDVEDLLLLVIDEMKLDVPLKREEAPEVGMVFPHIYGPLPLAAVVEVRHLQQGSAR